MGVFWIASVPIILDAFERVAMTRGVQVNPLILKVISA